MNIEMGIKLVGKGDLFAREGVGRTILILKWKDFSSGLRLSRDTRVEKDEKMERRGAVEAWQGKYF